MSDELLNILSNSNKDIDNQKLMDYLSDKLSAGEKHEFEKNMADSEMLSDIVEGLENFKNKKDVSGLVEQLNTNLKKQLDKKKSKKLKRKIKDLPWLYLSIVLILILIVISFIVIKKHLENEKPTNNFLKKEITNTTLNKKPVRANGIFIYSRKPTPSLIFFTILSCYSKTLKLQRYLLLKSRYKSAL